MACLALLLFRPVPVSAQRPLNLDFEEISISRRGTPKYWVLIGSGGSVVLDTYAPYSGTYSLRIQRPAADAFSGLTQSLPPHLARGRTIRFSGMIRTEAVEDGYAGLWWRVDGPEREQLAFDNMAGRGVTGTTPWKRHSIELDVPSTAENIVFGVLFPGHGSAWFDDLEIEINGRPYQEVARLEAAQPGAEDIEWLCEHAHPFVSSDAGQGFEDLSAFKEMVGDARIVALGEGTHGTSEFFRMKHRLVEHLASEADFTVFAIEANMPEAMRVNEYVQTGEGDPAQALAGLYFWTWNTREVLDLIEWMREFNRSGRGRIEFWGFDMQTPTIAIPNVESFVGAADPAYVPAFEKEYGLIRAYQDEEIRIRSGGFTTEAQADHRNRRRSDWAEPAERVLVHLESRRGKYLMTRPGEEVDWAIQNARVVLQAADTEPGGRDRHMAENVGWIMDHHPPETRMVLWAHNGHVSRRPNTMGGHLDRTYGADLRVVGFAFGEGKYRAIGADGLSEYAAIEPPAGSVEHYFRTAGLPRFILDLRAVAGRAWLDEPRELRSIGSMALDYGFVVTPVIDCFDVLIYFDQTSPSVGLGGR